MPSPEPQNTSRLVGQTPMNRPGPCYGYRVDPQYHIQDENHTAPPDSKIKLSDGPFSPAHLNKTSQEGKGV